MHTGFFFQFCNFIPSAIISSPFCLFLNKNFAGTTARKEMSFDRKQRVELAAGKCRPSTKQKIGTSGERNGEVQDRAPWDKWNKMDRK